MILEAFDEVLLRGLRLLFTEFAVGAFTLWSSFAFGTVFMMAASIPLVCTALYDWNAAQGSMLQAALFVAGLLGFGACIVQDQYLYPHLAARKAKGEARLYLSLPATLCGISAGIFIYAWLAIPGTPWPTLAIGLVLTGFGITYVVQAVAVYITNCYTVYAASAISAIVFGENIFAAFLLLATWNLYASLCFQWAGSLLGFVALALSLAPLLLVIFAARTKAQSKHLNSDWGTNTLSSLHRDRETKLIWAHDRDRNRG